MFIIIGLTARRGGEGRGKRRWRANTCALNNGGGDGAVSGAVPMVIGGTREFKSARSRLWRMFKRKGRGGRWRVIRRRREEARGTCLYRCRRSGAPGAISRNCRSRVAGGMITRLTIDSVSRSSARRIESRRVPCWRGRRRSREGDFVRREPMVPDRGEVTRI